MKIEDVCDRIAFEPEQSRVAAQLMREKLMDETTWDGFSHYVTNSPQLDHSITEMYDTAALALVIEQCGDVDLKYMGIKILIDRYLLGGELPEWMFMRVAMGLASVENPEDRMKYCVEFYKVMRSLRYMPSTPTLFNSCTHRPQMSSCYVTSVPDSLEGIAASNGDHMQLSKFAGGLGNNWTNVRGMGSGIEGTGGESQGVIPFMKVSESIAVAVNQSGKRKGAFCAFLETWHLDIEEFLELRKNTGDDLRRTHNMNTANWVPDLFMERVINDDHWTLFSPNEVPELTESWGEEFRGHYEKYERMVGDSTFKGISRTVSAKGLWRKMIGMLFETGHPWINFKDTCNRDNPMSALGMIKSSNLCTEITLNTSADEIAVCNLGSVNAAACTSYDLAETVRTAVRMLDNVIDYNFYPVEKAERTNRANRPIGLGIMGLNDAFVKKCMPFDSDEAVNYGANLMCYINKAAGLASQELAKEKGIFPNWKHSNLEQEQRNSHVTAIAPTATIANICGVNQSIEPVYQNLYVKSNLSGEFTIINEHLVAVLRELNLWDDDMLQYLRVHDGSIQQCNCIPEHVRKQFKTAFEIAPEWVIKHAAARTPYVSQSQSINLYVSGVTGNELSALYIMAWEMGLKTTYYLRTLAATGGVDKSSVDDGDGELPKACSIVDPDCEACQ